MDNSFNDIEKVAVATVIFKLIGADKKYEKKELQYMHGLFLNYDIPLIIPAASRIGYEKAIECLSLMSEGKKSILRDILEGLAECDSTLDKSELEIIQNVLV